ncbi:TetR/AcrR family transcriptional regulator [Roseiarcaceae bacterium H3SJ34-1]|uniref:TetR/AcrR family transcriptional regulator n=1 Tax=Terripilifer ovatus TaxID=3032367 RepID=UPI003AB95FF3|nr:TetR/AcrR family transcriptional regulator [Roseiarcaceae bacterium H3SJ34-1]
MSVAKEHILNAAEEVFAELGYAGTSLREIVERAQVTKALANYYFGSKEKLFEEVFLRRSLPVAEARMQSLADLRRTKGKAIPVRDLVRIYLTPLLPFPQTAMARNFMLIHARLHMEPEEFALALRRRVYNESTRAYAEALHDALPHLPLKTIYWRLILLVGANLYAISGTHRIEELSNGICDPTNSDELLEHLSDFVHAGLTAPVSAETEQRTAAPGRAKNGKAKSPVRKG